MNIVDQDNLLYCAPTMMHAYHLVKLRDLVEDQRGNLVCPVHKGMAIIDKQK